MDDIIHPSRLPFAEMRFEQWQQPIRRHIPNDDQSAVAWPVNGLVKGFEIIRGQRPDAVGGAYLRRRVSVGRTVDGASKSQCRDGVGIVAPVTQRDEALLPQALELLLRKRRALGDIGHQRQRIGKALDRHVQLKRR